MFYLLQEKIDLQDRKERKQVTTQNHLEVKKRMKFCDKNLNFSGSRLLSSGLKSEKDALGLGFGKGDTVEQYL